MMHFWLFYVVFSLNMMPFIFSDEIPVRYQLMNHEMFQKTVVGNTIVGITRQSHSLYMLYFLPDGSCELWKQNQIYFGSWWLEKDKCERDCVRAFWPQYTSSERESLFSIENPHYGKATTVRYYFDLQSGAIFLAGRKFQTSVILAPGCAFPLHH